MNTTKKEKENMYFIIAFIISIVTMSFIFNKDGFESSRKKLKSLIRSIFSRQN